MGYPNRLARVPDTNNNDKSLTEYGVPVTADETGAAVDASRLFGAAAVVLYGPTGAIVSSTAPLPVNATVTVNPPSSATGTVTSSGATTSTAGATLLASNAARKGASIYNDSTANLYVLLSGAGTVAAAGPFSIKMVAASYFEVPFGYTGRITGIWDAVNGAARLTEYS